MVSCHCLNWSRPSEIRRVLPPFAEAVAKLQAARPDLQVIIPAAPTVAGAVHSAVEAWAIKPHIVEGDRAKYDAMKAATVALACSGTVTIELALAGCPMVVAYRIDGLTYALVNWLVRRPITLFNIAAKSMVAPEFIQEDCTGTLLAAAVAERLDDPALMAAQAAKQLAALDIMGRGGPDPSIAAAEAVVRIVGAHGL